MAKYFDEKVHPLRFRITEDDDDAVEIERQKQGDNQGDIQFILTSEDVEALKSGKILFGSTGECPILIKWEDNNG